jgi:hypothetical protein
MKCWLTGTSSHWSSFPMVVHLLQGLPSSQAKCARLHGAHALMTFGLPPNRLTGDVLARPVSGGEGGRTSTDSDKG